MSKFKAVLFDFDGTIMNTNNVILNSWRHTFKTKLGVEPDPQEIYKTFGEVLKDTMKKFFPDEDQDEMIDIYRSYQKDIFTEAIEIFPGMKEVILKLHEAGIKVAIVTSRYLNSTVEGLKKYGIDEVFDAMVSAEDTEIHKPLPEPCLICLKKLGIEAKDAVMVGDSKYDILCARNAGVESALVSWTISVSEEERKELVPEYYIEKAEDLLDVVLG